MLKKIGVVRECSFSVRDDVVETELRVVSAKDVGAALRGMFSARGLNIYAQAPDAPQLFDSPDQLLEPREIWDEFRLFDQVSKELQDTVEALRDTRNELTSLKATKFQDSRREAEYRQKIEWMRRQLDTQAHLRKADGLIISALRTLLGYKLESSPLEESEKEMLRQALERAREAGVISGRAWDAVALREQGSLQETARLRAELAGKEQTIGSLQHELHAAKRKQEEAEQRATALQEKVSSLEGRLGASEDIFQTLDTELGKVRAERDTYCAALRAFYGAVKEASRTLEEMSVTPHSSGLPDEP
jgi:chromosome segregation ATPase